MGVSRPDEYRNQKRRLDTVLVQLRVCTVLHPVIILSERLVVAGHDGSDYPVVLVVSAVGRQALCMELTDTLPDSQVCAT